MNLFWSDWGSNIEITYETFFYDLTKSGKNNRYIKDSNPYMVFLNLLRNLISEKKSFILDADLSDEEIAFLEIKNEDLKKGEYFQTDQLHNFKSINDVIHFISSKQNKLELEILTSGTTGKPKKVLQSVKNVIREVKITSKYRKNKWGFAYNPTHFAGLQVFFQAFFNQNPLIFIFHANYEKAYESLQAHRVTHLSCTPTFMKLLLPSIKKPIKSIISLTFGGEKFDQKIQDKINENFPNAAVRNIYASTEAGSLLRADGQHFTIPDKYSKHIKIENNELLIHKLLLGFSRSFIFDEGWYRTGDLVELINEKQFKFLSRKSEIINVGGFNVNPNEVEEVIKKMNGVLDVLVTGRKNSITGNIIIADVIRADNKDFEVLKSEIKNLCNEQLQNFKRPRIINFVDSFELTRTGKQKK